MDEKQVSDYVLIIMKNLNFIIILYIAGLMFHSLSGYITENEAINFIISSQNTTFAPWKILSMTLGLYVMFLLIMCMNIEKIFCILIKVFIEMILCIFISSILSFSYFGIILLVLADTIKHFPKSKLRFPIVIIICFFYLIINYEFLSIKLDIIPFETYLNYYQNNAKLIMLGLKNLLNSLNTFIFFIYMILIVRTQMNEKEKIISLNQHLNVLNDELKKANLQLAEYAKEAEQMVATRERNRLAREIHDTLGHTLTGIITGIDACMALIDVAPEATKQQLKIITEVARNGMQDVRRSVKALRTDALERYGLEKAIYNIVEDMSRVANVDIQYTCSVILDYLNNEEEEVIYRIVQESITNAIRHGKANKIHIDMSEKSGLLVLKVKDNGKGCVNIKKGFGLHHMEERLKLFQGKLSYNGENGFTIEAQMPMRETMEEEND